MNTESYKSIIILFGVFFSLITIYKLFFSQIPEAELPHYKSIFDSIEMDHLLFHYFAIQVKGSETNKSEIELDEIARGIVKGIEGLTVVGRVGDLKGHYLLSLKRSGNDKSATKAEKLLSKTLYILGIFKLVLIIFFYLGKHPEIEFAELQSVRPRGKSHTIHEEL